MLKTSSTFNVWENFQRNDTCLKCRCGATLKAIFFTTNEDVRVSAKYLPGILLGFNLVLSFPTSTELNRCWSCQHECLIKLITLNINFSRSLCNSLSLTSTNLKWVGTNVVNMKTVSPVVVQYKLIAHNGNYTVPRVFFSSIYRIELQSECLQKVCGFLKTVPHVLTTLTMDFRFFLRRCSSQKVFWLKVEIDAYETRATSPNFANMKVVSSVLVQHEPSSRFVSYRNISLTHFDQ